MLKKRRSLRNKKVSEQEICNMAYKGDMITSTNSYVVSVLCLTVMFVKVKEVEELDNLDAIKKTSSQLTATATKTYRRKTNATDLVESRATYTNLLLLLKLSVLTNLIDLSIVSVQKNGFSLEAKYIW